MFLRELRLFPGPTSSSYIHPRTHVPLPTGLTHTMMEGSQLCTVSRGSGGGLVAQFGRNPYQVECVPQTDNKQFRATQKRFSCPSRLLSGIWNLNPRLQPHEVPALPIQDMG
jgi:hypothetical protein